MYRILVSVRLRYCAAGLCIYATKRVGRVVLFASCSSSCAAQLNLYWHVVVTTQGCVNAVRFIIFAELKVGAGTWLGVQPRAAQLGHDACLT